MPETPAAAASRAAPLCRPDRGCAPRRTDRQTDCQVPCACPESRAAPAEWETAARAPAVRKGPGSCTKRQKQPVTCPSHVGIAAQPCLLKEQEPAPSAPLFPCKQQLRLAGSCALVCGGFRKTETPRVFQINSLSYPLEACQRATVSLKIK